MGPRRSSTTELFQAGQEADIEYFFASDASAIIEHTNRVIYLEDDDVAAIRNGFFMSYSFVELSCCGVLKITKFLVGILTKPRDSISLKVSAIFDSKNFTRTSV